MEEDTQGGQRLRLLSYNIQVGISTTHPRHYLTKSWKHILPARRRFEHLEKIARVMREHDIVGLQELDAGSHRTGYVDMTEFLANHGHYPYWHHQLNRNLGRVAQHGNAILSRLRPSEIVEHKLPGLIPGRGGLHVRFGEGEQALHLLLLHLALGQRTRMRQLDYIGEIVNNHRHVVVMGDLNCRAESREMRRLFATTRLTEPVEALNTYPSWRPEKNIDHILVTSELEVGSCQVLDYSHSDHLPISMEVVLPKGVRLPE